MVERGDYSGVLLQPSNLAKLPTNTTHLRQLRQEQIVDLRHDRAHRVDGEDEITQGSARCKACSEQAEVLTVLRHQEGGGWGRGRSAIPFGQHPKAAKPTLDSQ